MHVDMDVDDMILVGSFEMPRSREKLSERPRPKREGQCILKQSSLPVPRLGLALRLA